MDGSISSGSVESNPAKSSIEDARYMISGHYWDSTRDVPPDRWVQGNKKICNCNAHQASQWPMDHAVIRIPPCAYKCPYCAIFDASVNPAPQVAKLRAHIRQVHLKNEHEFPGLTVQAGRASNSNRTVRAAHQTDLAHSW